MPKRFKWTPEAESRLRQLSRENTTLEIARILGCTKWAILSRRYAIRLKERDYKDLLPVQRIARIHSVSLRAVELVGLDALDLMGKTERKHALWNMQKRLNRTELIHEKNERVKRIMQLTTRIELLRKSIRKAA